MKSLFLAIPAVLLAVLTACGPLARPEATPAPTATPAAMVEPTPTPTAAPTPTPDPSAGLDYEMLTLPTTPQPPHVYDGQFMPNNAAGHDNGLAFVEALYTNDTEKLRSVLSDSLLDSGLSLPDLTGLVITDVSVGGGLYEVPYATLTIADPGATGLPAGNHEFRFSFDAEGKVEEFYLQDGDLEDAVARGMGLEPGAWIQLGSLDVKDTLEDDAHLTAATRVVGRKQDALGWTVGEVRAFAITERKVYDGHSNLTEYAMTSCQELPGNWPVLRNRTDWYTQPPEGNCLSDEQLQSVSDQLNDFFARLRDGTYTGEWVDDPVRAALSVWDAARPVPVAVTPEVLRSDVLQYPNPDIAPQTRVWIPLPDSCWAVCSLTEEGSLNPNFSFSFALAEPAAD
ncbi:hypothetical protein [uncultured Subdoligranulum sp.]|uniref:hypothetical protein n=1 Tax=uncultured Subdoligranulum sp. TaxID=512298 RepID=UPI0026329DD6|nr:hypothetical protein [uncultured Subdoligranulum sp.]